MRSMCARIRFRSGSVVLRPGGRFQEVRDGADFERCAAPEALNPI